jgi:heptosyltransferase-2
MKNVLIIQTAFIGDVILATALIEQVKEKYPNAKIDFLLRSGNESLLSSNPNINTIHIWNKKNKIRSMISIIFEIRKTKYDLLLNIQRFLNSGLIGFFSKATTKVCFDKNPLHLLYTRSIKHQIPHKTGLGFAHEVQRNSQLLDESLIDQYQRPALYFSKSEEEKISTFQDAKYIVMAPSSVWFTKQMPKEKWIELIKNSPSEYEIFIIGAPNEKEYLQSIINESDRGTLLAGQLSLKESALLMKKAQRVFVNDSGPLHLASSVNAKTTVFFCSTIPEFGYGPLSEDSIVIETAPRQECSPCGLHGKKECPLTHFKCAYDININKAIESI